MKLNFLTQEENLLRGIILKERKEYIFSRYEYWDEKSAEFYKNEGQSPRFWMALGISEYLFKELHLNLCIPGSF